MMINITEEEEKWLYADDTEQEFKNEEVPCANTSEEILQEISLEVAQPTSNEDPRPEFESDEENFEEDSDDDDGIIVSIGNTDVKPTLTHDTPSIKINGGLLAAKVEKAQPVTQLKTLLPEDFSEAGNIDGTPVAEFNIDNIVEKPWRQPGAAICDYFNYDFNENTWTAYCERQKRIRQNESGSGHLQSNTPHCAIPVISDNPVIILDRPDSHGSLVFPDMSKPPPMLNLGRFKPEPVFNSEHKPSPEKSSHTFPGPPIPHSTSSTRSNSNTRSIKSVQEEKSKFSKERDLKNRRERSRERHNKGYERREKSRSRSRRPRSPSQSRSRRPRSPSQSRSRRPGLPSQSRSRRPTSPSQSRSRRPSSRSRDHYYENNRSRRGYY